MLSMFTTTASLAAKYKTRWNPHSNKPDWVFNMGDNAPEYSDSDCSAGEMAYDTSYLYVCVADDTWKRTSLAAFAAASAEDGNVTYGGEYITYTDVPVNYSVPAPANNAVLFQGQQILFGGQNVVF